MTTRTTEQIKADFPLRTYEITWSSGRRERIQATRVELPHHYLDGQTNATVSFYGSLDREDGTGLCGRLLLVAPVGTALGIVSIRDTEAVRGTSFRARLQRPAFWSRFLNVLTFNR